MINALGSLAPFLGNFLIGALKDASGSYAVAMLPLVALSAIGAVALVISSKARPADALAQPQGAP
jgi:hypothetical protein